VNEDKVRLPIAIRRLLRRSRSGLLATALAGEDGGWPYGSLVTVAFDMDASPLFLFSNLSDHTRNLRADPRASLLVEAASRRANPQTGPRVTVLGRVARSEDERHRRRFLARHPGAKMYADFADFGFYRLTVERAHFVGGFARAVWVEGERLTLDVAAAAIAACEADVIQHMNEDHADALDLYANNLLGRRGKGWSMIGLDPDGLDLCRGAAFARLDFETPIVDAESCRVTLVRLATDARRKKSTGTK
jgi:putative heme iron utilization protein